MAASKTEVVVLTRQRGFPDPLRVDIDGVTVEAGNKVKYLGVTLDAKLPYGVHIQEAAAKAMKMVASLSRLMPNVSGPAPAKRRMLMSVVHSVLLYGAEVWADALSVEKYRRKMPSVQ